MGLIILPRTHTLGISRVQPISRVLPLRAMHLNGNPEPDRTVCTSFFSLQVARAFSFHVAREAAIVFRKGRCSQSFSATMVARDPRANHHSSSHLRTTIAFNGSLVLTTLAGFQVHFPFFLMRQYSFAMYTASGFVYINLVEHQFPKNMKSGPNGFGSPMAVFCFFNCASLSGRIASTCSSTTSPIFFRCLYT